MWAPQTVHNRPTSRVHTGIDSLISHHFEADSWLLPVIPGSLPYLLPGHMSASVILNSYSLESCEEFAMSPIQFSSK